MKLFLKSISYASIYSLAIGFLTLLATPQEAQAQDAAAAELDEVTVTARRREESLQDVPIAVSAFSGTQLEEIGAVDIVSLSQYTPNVTLEVSRATNTTLTAYIRGVGQQDPLAGFEGGVGMYLDDVYLARPKEPCLTFTMSSASKFCVAHKARFMVAIQLAVRSSM